MFSEKILFCCKHLKISPFLILLGVFGYSSSYYVLTSLTKSLLSKTTQMNTAVGYSDGGGL